MKMKTKGPILLWAEQSQFLLKSMGEVCAQLLPILSPNGPGLSQLVGTMPGFFTQFCQGISPLALKLSGYSNPELCQNAWWFCDVPKWR